MLGKTVSPRRRVAKRAQLYSCFEMQGSCSRMQMTAWWKRACLRNDLATFEFPSFATWMLTPERRLVLPSDHISVEDVLSSHPRQEGECHERVLCLAFMKWVYQNCQILGKIFILIPMLLLKGIIFYFYVGSRQSSLRMRICTYLFLKVKSRYT